MAARVSKHWGGINPRYNITEFNADEITADNLVNQIVLLKPKDISNPLILTLFGSFNDKVLVHQYDTFEVPVGAFEYEDEKGRKISNSKPFITTFGIWVFNIFMIKSCNYSFLFNGYINEEIDKKKFGKIHRKICYALLEDKIDTISYKKFITNADFMMPWETTLSPAQSEKMLSCTKEVNKLKARLIKENKEKLDAGDPAVAKDIEDQLLKFVLEYLKDDPAIDGYLSGAGGTLSNNFKNMYLMKGAVRNPDPTAKKEFDIAMSSFIDGISADEYSVLSNSLAGGPYSRAKKTELGGYWEKLISYALNTVVVDEPGTDCGTDKYLEVVLTDDVIDTFIYNYIIGPNGKLIELTSDNIDNYRNKKVKVRSALFCKQTKPGCLCNACAGNFFERRGNRKAGLACPSIPTKLKLVSMKSFHDSTVKITEIDPMKAFGFK